MITIICYVLTQITYVLASDISTQQALNEASQKCIEAGNEIGQQIREGSKKDLDSNMYIQHITAPQHTQIIMPPFALPTYPGQKYYNPISGIYY
jgi:hypothetical protein